MDKKIKLNDAIVDDIAFYLGRAHLIPGRPGVTTYPPRAETMDARRIVSAVLNHPDAAGLFADEDDLPWEPLKGPGRVGDEVRQDYGGVTHTGVVARVDLGGGLWTTGGGLIGLRDVGTWHVRRHVQELPTEDGAVIVPAEGYEAIDATWDGFGWLASEAVLGEDGKWHGVWRREVGRGVVGSVGPECITTRTCKVDDQ